MGGDDWPQTIARPAIRSAQIIHIVRHRVVAKMAAHLTCSHTRAPGRPFQAVYRARDPRLGREVPIKVLPPAFRADADRLRGFEEARAAGQLSHPHILAVHDVGLHDGSPYIVCELLEGETLRSRLHSGPVQPERP